MPSFSFLTYRFNSFAVGGDAPPHSFSKRANCLSNNRPKSHILLTAQCPVPQIERPQQHRGRPFPHLRAAVTWCGLCWGGGKSREADDYYFLFLFTRLTIVYNLIHYQCRRSLWSETQELLRRFVKCGLWSLLWRERQRGMLFLPRYLCVGGQEMVKLSRGGALCIFIFSPLCFPSFLSPLLFGPLHYSPVISQPVRSTNFVHNVPKKNKKNK